MLSEEVSRWTDALDAAAVCDKMTSHGHTEECRESIETMLTKDGDPRVINDIARQFSQHFKRARDEGEEPKEETTKRTKFEGKGSSASTTKSK